MGVSRAVRASRLRCSLIKGLVYIGLRSLSPLNVYINAIVSGIFKNNKQFKGINRTIINKVVSVCV